MTVRWYVAVTRQGAETHVARAIGALGIEVFLPLQRKTIRHARVEQRTYRALLPSLIFPAFEIEDATWTAITRIFGFTRFMGSRAGDDFMPTAVRSGEMEAFMDMARFLDCDHDEQDPLRYCQLRPNSRVFVRCTESFEAMGTVIRDDRGKVLIDLDKAYGGKRVCAPRDSVALAS